MSKRYPMSGFTLIELMVVVAIAAIMAAVTAPSFVTFIKEQRLRSAGNAILMSFQYMRIESMRLGQTITMCPSADGATCAGSNYSTGWIIFVDDDSNGSRTAGSEELLRVYPALGASETITLTGFGGNDYVSLGVRGRPGATGTVKVCDDRTGNVGKRVQMNLAGRPALTTAQACP